MRRTVLLCLLALCGSGGVWAQAGAGSAAVTGTVLEAAGDGIPDTTVVLTNSGLGLRRVMNTSDDGVFDAPALTPGAGYHIKVTRKGFLDWDSGDFDLAIGQTLDFRVTLKHAGETAADEGSIPPPRVEETKTGIGTLVSARQTDILPSPNRRLDPLAQVEPLGGEDHRTGRVVLAGQASSNLFLTDGVAATNTYYTSQHGIANQLTLDSVQEFQVLAANYSAGFGPAMGGIINAVTRSGSNSLHLAGYDYFRPGSLAAANRYAPGQTLFDHQNQGGIDAGGPIRRDQIFFFGNFEVLDGKGSGMNRISNPLLAEFSGCKATAAQCAAATRFIQAQMNVLVPLTDRWVTGLAKIDYRRSERNSFTFTGNAMNAEAPNGGSLQQVAPNGGLLGLVNSSDHIRYGKAAWISAPTRNTLNEMRLGTFDDRLSNPASDPALAIGSLGVVVDGVTVGNPRPSAQSLSELRYQLTDNFTATSNTHSVNLGIELWRTRDTVNSLAGPQYVYPSLTAFAQDFTSGGKDYTMFTQQVGTGLRRVPDKQYNAYAFDTWRPVRRLTIVAGVRFEKPELPHPQQISPNYYQTGTITSPNVNFAPRLSVAYRWSNHTTLRVGYGWFYQPMPGQLLDALYSFGNGVNMTDLTVLPTMANAPLFPHALTASSTIPTGAPDVIYASSKLRNPYVRDENIALERRLDANTTLTVTLLHSRGYRLYSVADVNLAAPTVSKVYAIDNAAGQQVGSYYTDMYTARNDTRYAHVYNVANGGSSWYNAAFVELRRRMSHGLTVQASYRFSHSLDDTAGPLLYGVLPLNTYNGNVGGDRGTSPFDQRHRGVVDWTWQPDQRWLKGWTLSGIATMASGQPETPLVWVAGQQFSSINMVYPTSLNGWGGWSRLPLEGIGSLMTGPQYNVDARLSRTFNMRERLKAVLLFEAFNAFNTQFDTALNTTSYVAAATAPPSGAVNGPTTGVLKPVSGLGTGIAGSPPRTGQIGLRLTF